MLQDYIDYLENLEDNLIESGLPLPKETIDTYSDTCKLEERLTNVVWFYTVVGVGFTHPFIPELHKAYVELPIEEGSVDYSMTENIPSSGFLSEGSTDDEKPITDVEYENLFTREELESVTSLKSEEPLESEVEEVDYYPLPPPSGFDSYIDGDDEFLYWGWKEKNIGGVEGEGSSSNLVGDESDEDYSNWGNTDEEEYSDEGSEVVDYEDEFSNWGNSDEEESVEEDSYPEEEYEESFSNWGSSDEEEEEEYIEEDNYPEEEYEDEFSNWGNTDEEDEEEYSEEDSYSEEEYEDEFSNWGNRDEDDEEEEDSESYSEEEYEDSFSNWGNSDEEEEEEYLEEDTFGNWGNTDDDLEESDSGVGNSSSISDGDSGATVHSIDSGNFKSKYDLEVESNEKTAMVINKIAGSVFKTSFLFKNKMSDRLKSLNNYEND